MSEKSSFFNAVINGGIPDRSYKAEEFARFFSSFIGNGVFPNPSTNLQVLSLDNNMTVNVKQGLGWINGYFYENTDNLRLSVDNADGVLNRIDLVVVRLDFITREITCKIKKGTFASNPVVPQLTRTSDRYELCISTIRVNAGSTAITQSVITDTRLDSDVCGIVTQTVKEIDTTELYNKLQAYIDERGQDVDAWVDEATTRWERDFISWFNTIKDILDGDIAGALANRILELENVVNNLELTSTKVMRPNKKTVEESISANETSILSHGRDIENLKQSVSNGKTLVANAITDKGVPTLATDSFQQMASNINIINACELVQADNPHFYVFLNRRSGLYYSKNTFDNFGIVTSSNSAYGDVHGGFDGIKSRLFYIEGATTLKELDTDTFAIINTITMPKNYRTITIGFDGIKTRVFVSYGSIGSGLYEVDIDTFEIITVLPQNGICYNVSLNYINDGTSRLIVLNINGGYLDEYDLKTNTLNSHKYLGHNTTTSYASSTKNDKNKAFATQGTAVVEMDVETNVVISYIPFLFSNTTSIRITCAFETVSTVKYNNEIYYK